MKLSVVFAVALAALVEAKANFTNDAASFATIEANKPFELTWAGGEAPYTIVLQNGDPLDLKDVQTLATGLTTESTTITLPGTLASGIYTFQIIDGTKEPNWSVRWNFQSLGSTSTPTTSGSTTKTGSTDSTTTTDSTRTTSNTSSNTSSTSSTRSSSTRTTATTTPTATPADTNDALRARSPLALVLVTVVALLYFN
ncbi:extracellular matrix protein [Coniochaeta sp. 2T2.1]|nr:extracellular matrix protein [Coniochaeta sp. 2T2.1]